MPLASWDNPHEMVELEEALRLTFCLIAGKDWLGAEFRIYGLVQSLAL